ncbi:MAG: ComEC/Rec2 family competence protein [Planctomycetes bacterium]|nr:ComEC/Rec2 family competence protein [Planctomycetota bacterium]
MPPDQLTGDFWENLDMASSSPTALPATGGHVPPAEPLSLTVSAAWRRVPSVPVALAFSAGILADHYADLELPQWFVACALSLLAWAGCLVRRQPSGASVCLLLAVLAAGGGWHHWRWSIVGADHISRYAEETPQPVRLSGRLVEQPWVQPRRQQAIPSAVPQVDHTLAILECRQLMSATGEQSVSGRVRLDIAGHLTDVSIGDEVEVVGSLSRPVGPSNPGAFDFRRFLRTEGLLATVRCDEPDDVQKLTGGINAVRRWQSTLRSRAERLIESRLSSDTAPVAVALLLGTRSAIPEDLRTAFAESGTMHILAISGSNVGILAGLLWTLARLAGLGRTGSVIFILSGVLGYSFLADSQPPVMRAVLMVVALLAGRPWHRDGTMVNGLALAALGVLIWNPAHLFDVGAQLSFLAVAALIWAPTCSRWLRRFIDPPLEPLAELENARLARFQHWLRRILIQSHVTMAAVWLFTLPLTMARFHLLSPVGFFVNVLLAPLVVVILWCGYALLLVGFIAPVMAAPFALLFDQGLGLMLKCVRVAANVPAGHLYLPGPSDGWLVGFYLCLAAVAFGVPGGRARWWGWRALLLWTVGGLAWGLLPQKPGELRCTFLSVGHGLAVVVQLPNGRTVVYDAGQLDNPHRAQQAVQQALWEFGARRIDALVISHADVDHFNGVPGLAQTLPIDVALIHNSFLDFQQASVKQTCDLLADRKVPIRTTNAGDQVPLDPSVQLDFLHPPAFDRLPTDNANSLVLLIEYRGRRILLTGDLERDGLEYVLMQAPRHIDVLLAPHHGRANASPRRLAEWATPDWVVVSDGRHDSSRQLSAVYGPAAQVVSTHQSGAITFVIDRQGELTYHQFRPGSSDRPPPAAVERETEAVTAPRPSDPQSTKSRRAAEPRPTRKTRRSPTGATD